MMGPNRSVGLRPLCVDSSGPSEVALNPVLTAHGSACLDATGGLGTTTLTATVCMAEGIPPAGRGIAPHKLRT